MNQKERDIQRKLRILKHAEEIGSAVKTCRYFGIALPFHSRVHTDFIMWLK